MPIHMQWTTGTTEAADCGTGLAAAVASGLCHPATECLRNCHGWPMALGGRTGHIALPEECAGATRPPCHILLVKLGVGSTSADELGHIWGQLVPEKLNQLGDWLQQAVPALIWFGIPGAPAPCLHRALVRHPARTGLPHGAADTVDPHDQCQYLCWTATGCHHRVANREAHGEHSWATPLATATGLMELRCTRAATETTWGPLTLRNQPAMPTMHAKTAALVTRHGPASTSRLGRKLVLHQP